MSEPLVRDAGPDDVGRACEIAVAAWQPIYEGYRRAAGDAAFERMFPDASGAKAGQIRAFFDPQPHDIIVTVCDGVVAGFATWAVEAGGKIGQVGNNAVHPDFQGRGIGAIQLREVLARLRAAGCQMARVFTGLDDGHAAARAMYEREGFRSFFESVTYIREV